MNKYLILIVFIISSLPVLPDDGNWTLVDEYIIKINDTVNVASWYVAIDCPDENNCMAFGDLNHDYRLGRRTTNGGQTWQTVYRDSIAFSGPHPPPVGDITYPDTNLALALCDSCIILRSTDKGNTWTEKKLNCIVKESTWMSMRIKMFDKNFGAILTYWDLYVTNDGGLNWDKKSISLDSSIELSTYDRLSIPDSGTILFNAYDKKKKSYFMIYSTDKGKTWGYNPPTDTSYSFGGIFFKDRDNGWALKDEFIPDQEYRYKKVIIYTSDRGKTWTKQLDTIRGDPTYGLTHLHFVDSLNGVAWSEYSYDLWNTTDGGKNWKFVDSYNSTNLMSLLEDIKMLTPDKWIGATYSQMRIYKYTKNMGASDFQSIVQEDKLHIFPNVLNRQDELNLILDQDEYSTVRFEIINSLGAVIDYSGDYQLPPGENKIIYNTKNLSISGMYWLRAVVNNEKFIIKTFIVR